MSIEVALIDFPRLQEQIATRLLSEYQANVHHLTHREAAERLSMFDLALLFWPDASMEAAGRLQHLRATNSSVPVALVTSEAGRRNAETMVGSNAPADILITPLQPYIVSRQLGALLGKTHSDPTSTLRADYLNPFIEATVMTLRQMAQMECERTGLSLRTDAATRGFISGTMGLSGSAEGFVSVTFNNDLARCIVCHMLQINVGEETEEDIRDGVGEFMNMIAGVAKAGLAGTAYSFQLSLPNVIVGGPHTLGQIRGVPVVVVEFTTEEQPFEVMVCLRPKE